MKTVPESVVPGKLKFKKKTQTRPQPQIQMPTEVRTKAELAYLQAQRDKQSQRISEHLKISHKERIENYNKRLGSLPEHFDLPKSSSG